MRAVLAMTAAVMSLCLTAGAVQADAPLASHWRLDEAAGSTTADAVTGATGTLSGNAEFGPGKSGSGVAFTGGTVTGPLAVDTANSFTVSAWVNLSAECPERACKYTAVSGDGVRSSRFSLGYTKSRDLLGNWSFEVTEADTDRAPVTVMAVGPEVAEPGEWTHLVGVYNAEERRTYLYVVGSLVGEGVTNTQWSGTGGFTVGAARKAGVTTAFFPGSVDEVEFYDTAFTHNEVFELYLRERG
jgi:Concanavalin A-like lectin/glucanases superfamily